MNGDIIHLSVDLCERLGLLAIIFFLLMRFDLFRRLLTGKITRREKFFHAGFFALAGIFATYSGFPVEGAIANLRAVPLAVGGILGGPLVGLAAGAIAGSHRYLFDMNGLTAVPCAIATLLEGVVAVLIYRRFQRKQFDSLVAFCAGIVIESIKMGLILMLTKPLATAITVVQTIGAPTILANAFGIAVLVELIASVAREQERAMAQQAQTTLNIAVMTLPYLRHGLNQESAAETARIIRSMTGLDAVSITNEIEILAHEGLPGSVGTMCGKSLSKATRMALTSGTTVKAMTKNEIGSTDPRCCLGSAIVVPLKTWDKTVGALKLFRREEQGISMLDVELANGLAHLFSNQLELGEIENQRKLVSEAEIKALQAQIKPHFLFNAISTIISYTRTDPQTASNLLVKLAEFFRKNITHNASTVPLSVELEHCEAYIAIEKARFEERLSIVYEIDDASLACSVPPLILQPLVENGVRHGIMPKEGGGVIHVGAKKDHDAIRIYVRDDGVGMSQEHISSLLSESSPTRNTEGLGLAIRNVNARLIALYGRDKALQIESKPGIGTLVQFSVPVCTP